jgi:hypothetical protein
MPCRFIQNSGGIHSVSIAFRSWEWDIASPDLVLVQVSDRFTSARMDVPAMRNSRARPLQCLAAPSEKEHVMRSLTCLALLTLSLVAVSPSQQASTTAVPNLVNYSGTLVLSEGVGVPAKMVGVTFAIYRQQDGGAPLWLETQNVTPDFSGHYTVLLGSTKAEGIPAELFNTREQLWLGVQMQGEAEQPRVLLVSVPYAMKAADAETIGGLPASAFVLAAPPNANPAIGTTGSEASGLAAPPTSSNVTTTGGTANTIPLFTTATNIQNSILTQTSTKAEAGSPPMVSASAAFMA